MLKTDVDSEKISKALNLLNKLYSDRETTGDVTFIIGSERIPAHRSVLAASSPKYEAQFYGIKPDEGDIYVENVSGTAFKEFIKFLYLGEADLTLETVEDFLNLKNQCLVMQFNKKSEIFLKDAVTQSNVCWIYQLAILYDLKMVQAKCEQMIRTQPLEAFASENFIDINRDTLLRILDIEIWRCSELEILESCIEWARDKCDQKGLNNEKGENIRAELGNAFSKIRLHSIALGDMIKFHKKYAGFFSPDEFVEKVSIINEHREATLNKSTPAAKFEPPVYTESNMLKVRHLCMTAMKEYEDKSLEELRFQVYYVRKDCEQSDFNTKFGATPDNSAASDEPA